MKQIIQDLKKGDTILEEVPVPRVKLGSVLIQTTRTLVSLGTERMLVDFGKANFIQKAKQQPEMVNYITVSRLSSPNFEDSARVGSEQTKHKEKRLCIYSALFR